MLANMDAETWNDNFGELNLHGKIVGNSCIDWSHDHQIAIGTNKKVVVCDMSMFIGGSKMEEIGYMIENVPVISEKQQESSPTPSFLSNFETASNQPSNTKAFPDYDVYKYFLDPALYSEKLKEMKGFKAIKFSHPGCTSATGSELLAVLSLDYSLGIYQKVAAGLHAKWASFFNLSSILDEYLVSNDNYFPDHSINDASSEFERYREIKHSACISCMSWSDIYDSEEEKICYLAACTLNGFIITWKFSFCGGEIHAPIIADTFYSNWSNISDITWLKNVDNNSHNSKPFLGLAVSSCKGQICCKAQSMSFTDKSSWKNCIETVLWDEKDRLCPRKLNWVSLQTGESLFLAAKSFILSAWIINDNLEVLSQCLLENVHSLPIVCLQLFQIDHKLQCYSSSSDGLMTLIEVQIQPGVALHVKDVIGKESDIGSYRVQSPSTLHATALSPSKAFMVMVTSRPHVRLSVQVDNEASIFMKRLITPAQAAEKLLQITASDTNESLYTYLDLLEITRQYYVMSKKFDPSLQNFLNNEDIKQEHDVRKLQLRWYLLKLKKRENKTSRRTLLVDEMRPLNCEEEEVCKLVEEVITVRQMMKVLTAWYQHSVDYVDSSLPVVPILKMLGTKEDFLNEKDLELVHNMRILPALNNLPLQQTCSFTALPAEMSSDCRTGNSLDGSSWPLCCLTFTLLQGYEKRKCELSGLYAAFPDADNPPWLNDQLNNPCIFSGAPLRRYIH